VFMVEIVPVIKAEIAALETDIRENPDPRERKLARLRETLAEYEPVPPATPAPSAVAPLWASPPPAAHLAWTNGGTSEPLLAASDAATTKAERMRRAITKLLQQRITLHRGVLLEHMLTSKIMGNETDPMQALAIFLSSHKELFESDGAGNFSLRKP
jgi:hypothetical protein